VARPRKVYEHETLIEASRHPPTWRHGEEEPVLVKESLWGCPRTAGRAHVVREEKGRRSQARGTSWVDPVVKLLTVPSTVTGFATRNAKVAQPGEEGVPSIPRLMVGCLVILSLIGILCRYDMAFAANEGSLTSSKLSGSAFLASRVISPAQRRLPQRSDHLRDRGWQARRADMGWRSR
jgi:hypothetical protein